MKQLVAILLITYFGLGAVVLPHGDFSLLPDLPKMYHHCKHHEDVDMNAIDFIKDHLVNIDGVFDKHEEGDDQKPHQPFDFQHQLPTITLAICMFEYQLPCFEMNDGLVFPRLEKQATSKFIPEVFRPPVS